MSSAEAAARSSCALSMEWFCPLLCKQWCFLIDARINILGSNSILERAEVTVLLRLQTRVCWNDH